MQSNGRIPIGYVDLESAAANSRYSAGYIGEMSRKGIIESIEKNGKTYFSLYDLKMRGRVPEGYMSFKEGYQYYHYSKNSFRKLVKKAQIPTLRVLNIIYFSVSDFEEFLKIPKGYQSLDEVVKTSRFSRDTIRKLLKKEKVHGLKKRNILYVSIDSLREYESAHKEKKNGKIAAETIDSFVNSIAQN